MKMNTNTELWSSNNYPWPEFVDPHNESVKRLEKRISELEDALENLMDAYQFMVGFDENYEKAQKVIKKQNKEE